MTSEEDAARSWLRLARTLTGSPHEREVVLTEGPDHVERLLGRLDLVRGALGQLAQLVPTVPEVTYDPDPTLDIDPTDDLP